MNKKINKEESELTPQEVDYVLKFAQSLSGLNMYGNALTPMMLNSRMMDITLSPLQATEDSLTKAMNNVKNSELVLQAFSQDFELQSQPYRRLLSYLTNLLSFDMTYECTNMKDPKGYKSPKYQADLDILKQFMDRFDYKKEFTTAVGEMIRNEAYFCLPHFDDAKITLQELPTSPTYTMITGRWAYGLMFSFNMYWFINPGVDINLYPNFFKQKYGNLWGDGTEFPQYMSNLSPQSRGDSSWVYWQDIPVDLGWCFKMNPTLATRVPYFSGLFLDLIQQPLMRALQKNINMSVAARLVLGQVGMLKDTAAKGKDQFNISPDNLGKFLALVKSALGESLRVAAAPLENLQSVAFPSENAMYSSYLQTTLATSGVNTDLIFTGNVRPNLMATQLSLNVDEQLMTALYPQFEDFMNYNINKLTKTYKFKIKFQGTQFFNNRQQRFDKQMQLSSLGMVLPQQIAASIGMNPFEFQRQLDEARAMGFTDNLTPITLAGQMSNDQKDQAGRPKKDDSELGDSGSETRESGGNVGRGGKQ